jgi:hypothetical protein
MTRLASALWRLRGGYSAPLRPLERALGGLRPRLLTSGTAYGAISVGVPKESFAGERRVALTPTSVAALVKAGIKSVLVESGAGAEAKFTDAGAQRCAPLLVCCALSAVLGLSTDSAGAARCATRCALSRARLPLRGLTLALTPALSCSVRGGGRQDRAHQRGVWHGPRLQSARHLGERAEADARKVHAHQVRARALQLLHGYVPKNAEREA